MALLHKYKGQRTHFTKESPVNGRNTATTSYYLLLTNMLSSEMPVNSLTANGHRDERNLSP